MRGDNPYHVWHSRTFFTYIVLYRIATTCVNGLLRASPPLRCRHAVNKFAVQRFGTAEQLFSKKCTPYSSKWVQKIEQLS